MSHIQPWFERRFDFTFPTEQHPNLCVRLRGTPARLEEILRPIARETLIGRREQNWSAQEHTGHFLDLEPLWIARVDDFLGDGEKLTVADLSNRKTHEANHNAREVREILAEFRTARWRLLERVANSHPGLFSRSKLHPRLAQPMRLADHLYFVAEHDDHHLARIWELTH